MAGELFDDRENEGDEKRKENELEMEGMGKVVLSANARPGIGGQGLNFQHMIQAYAEVAGKDRLSLFGQGPYEGIETSIIGQSPTSQLISRIPLVRRYRDFQVMLGDKYFDRSVARHLAATKVDFFQGATGQCLESLKMAKSHGVRTRLDVITVHAEVYQSELNEECEIFGIRGTLRPEMAKRMLEEYETADEIRVMSDVARRMFLERGFPEDRIFSANPPLDWEAFPAEEEIGIGRPERFTVAYAGLLEPAKGFHHLIKAFNGLDDPDARLHLWGSPGARPVSDFMKVAIHEDARIEMQPGSIREKGYRNVYGKSSVLVHPSLADGFGYVVAEAMACGIPVIVTENTGAGDLVQDGVNGFIVPIRDSDAILEKLETLHNSPDLLDSMGREARKSAQNLTLANFSRKIRQGL